MNPDLRDMYSEEDFESSKKILKDMNPDLRDMHYWGLQISFLGFIMWVSSKTKELDLGGVR